MQSFTNPSGVPQTAAGSLTAILPQTGIGAQPRPPKYPLNGGGAPGDTSPGIAGPGQQPFIMPDWAQPFQDTQNVANNLTSFGMQSVPGAGLWQADLFNPGLNNQEQNFMQSQADFLHRNVYDPAANQLGAQYGSTPFHSGYLNAMRTLNQNLGSDLNNFGGQLYMNRQNLASQAANRIMGNPLQNIQGGANAVGGLANLTSGLYNSVFQSPIATAVGAPLIAPSIITSPGSSGGKGK